MSQQMTAVGNWVYRKALLFFDSLMELKTHKGVIMQATLAYDIPYLKLQKKKAEEKLKV